MEKFSEMPVLTKHEASEVISEAESLMIRMGSDGGQDMCIVMNSLVQLERLRIAIDDMDMK